MTNLIQALLVPLIAIVGLIVLIALHDVSSSVGVPIIVGLAGVHLGANLGSAPTPTTTQSNAAAPLP